MGEYTKLFERAGTRFEAPSLSTERLLLRRDRMRRNQRITAGAVGLAVFVVAIWIVTSGLPSDRTQTPATSGPAVTGPTETGPAVTGPAIGPTGDPFSVSFKDLPPEGATPSEPLRGELVMSDSGIHPYYAVNLYADGRLIWARAVWPNPGGHGPQVSGWIEQRLTPEGVELLRSGAVPLGGQFENPGEQLPVSAWEDPTLRPYVPSKYAVFAYGVDKVLLPEPAADLLRRAERTGALTIEDARAFVEVLTGAGFEEDCCNGSGYVDAVVVSKGGNFRGFDTKGWWIEFVSLLPDGTFYETGG